jgi:hypothetical protein
LGEESSRVKERDEIRRLLSYLRPYTAPLSLGILLIAVMGIVEGITAFAIKPALDVVLNPQSSFNTWAWRASPI